MEKKSKKKMNACPDNETIINAFLEKSGLNEKERIIDHMLTCRSCSMKFDILIRLEKEIYDSGILPDETEEDKSQYSEFREAVKKKLKEIRSAKRPSTFGFIPKKHLAAAAALIVIIAGYFAYTNLINPNIVRNDRGTSLILLEPAGELKEPPLFFKWKDLGQADNYDIKIIDENLNIIARLNGYPSMTVPEEIRSQLKPGITYIWIVEARDNEDYVIAEAQKHFVIR